MTKRPPPDRWVDAERLEFEENDPAAAATVYAELAAQTQPAGPRARALMAQSRCLAKTDKNDAAAEVLLKLADPAYRGTTDRHGRFIPPNALSRAVHLLSGPAREQALGQLVTRLNDYSKPVMPSSQRLFLMRQVEGRIDPDDKAEVQRSLFPTHVAEALAAQHLAEPPDVPDAVPYLQPTGTPELWQHVSPDRRRVALFRSVRMATTLWGMPVPREVLVLPRGPEDSLIVSGGGPGWIRDPFLARRIDLLGGWRLALYLRGPDPFAEAAERQRMLYLWIGGLGILVVAVVAVLIGAHLRRQMRLTRLKNDFLATVSHELKTPLASMRVLVDTLLEGRYRDDAQVRDYLDLVAQENVRLSRMIDNFLTFSRMERNKQAFERERLAVADLVAEAVDAVAARFEGTDCRLDADVADGLPPVIGDRDALVTVLVNLLDNAHKYTGPDKHVHLSARAADGQVVLEVRDNGIGLSRREAKHVFDRFYQVDQTLSRKAGGCGLGLSIVQFIVTAHAGEVSVSSRAGEGSTFVVRIPGEGTRPEGRG